MCVVFFFVTTVGQTHSWDTEGDIDELGLCPNTMGPDGTKGDKILEHVIVDHLTPGLTLDLKYMFDLGLPVELQGSRAEAAGLWVLRARAEVL